MPGKFKQDTPMMQVVSCAQSIKMDAINIREGIASPEALQRIVECANDLLVITKLSKETEWKPEPRERAVCPQCSGPSVWLWREPSDNLPPAGGVCDKCLSIDTR